MYPACQETDIPALFCRAWNKPAANYSKDLEHPPPLQAQHGYDGGWRPVRAHSRLPWFRVMSTSGKHSEGSFLIGTHAFVLPFADCWWVFEVPHFSI